jgi:drug/metabolite transporter (DMT)-like permease
MRELLSILLCICTISVGQILLKLGTNTTPLDISTVNIETLSLLLKNWYLLSGMVVYIASFILWLYVLSHEQLSYAYPFVSLSYPLVILMSWALLGENISSSVWIGIILICLGVSLIGYSVH